MSDILDQNFYDLFQESPVVIVIHDEVTCEIVDANLMALEVHECESLEELQNKELFLSPPYSINEASENIRRTARDGYYECEWMNVTHTGLTYWYIRFRRINIGGINRVVSVGTDISALKKAEKIIKQQTEELEIKSNLLLQQNKKLEMCFLQAQINPHFLYNALNAIAATCRKDSNETEKLIVALSKYLRASFDYEHLEHLISFEKELEHIKAYLSIEFVRFKNIEFIYNNDAKVNFNLPPLTIQPIIENAIRHGLRKKNNRGFVKLEIIEASNGIQISVTDNGVGMSSEQIQMALLGGENKSVGLNNINTRLKQLYDTELSIKSNINEGTQVSFTIPNLLIGDSDA